MFSAVIVPTPPASATASASRGDDTGPIGACWIGTEHPTSTVNRVSTTGPPALQRRNPTVARRRDHVKRAAPQYRHAAGGAVRLLPTGGKDGALPSTRTEGPVDDLLGALARSRGCSSMVEPQPSKLAMPVRS